MRHSIHGNSIIITILSDSWQQQPRDFCGCRERSHHVGGPRSLHKSFSLQSRRLQETEVRNSSSSYPCESEQDLLVAEIWYVRGASSNNSAAAVQRALSSWHQSLICQLSYTLTMFFWADALLSSRPEDAGAQLADIRHVCTSKDTGSRAVRASQSLQGLHRILTTYTKNTKKLHSMN